MTADERAPTSGGVAASAPAGPDLDRTIARLLGVGTYVSVALLGIGVVALLATGQSPVEGTPLPLDLGRIPADILAFRPEGFLWPGIIVMIATPAARVTASLVGYARSREWGMAIVAFLILCVIAVGVAAAAASEG